MKRLTCVMLTSTVLALNGCAELKPVATDAAPCVVALLPVALNVGVSALPQAAMQTPACAPLARDVLNFAINEVAKAVAKAKPAQP